MKCTHHARHHTVLMCAVLFACASRAPAHDFTITNALLIVKSDQTLLLDVTLDLDALALGAATTTDSAQLAAQLKALDPATFETTVQQLCTMLERRIRIDCDGNRLELFVSLPDYETGLSSAASPGKIEPTVLGTTARLAARLPENPNALECSLSRAFGPVDLTIIEQGTRRAERRIFAAGEASMTFELGRPLDPIEDTVPPLVEFMWVGFRHILPDGIDHILFIAGLFLAATKLRFLLAQVTAFTVAHSVTLTLAVLGYVSISERFVEVIIALSITYVGIENIINREPRFGRTLIVFLFGLLHGMGFAGAIAELGLPRGNFAESLIGFNIGVELGQLAVIAIALVLLGWMRKKQWYRPMIATPASIGIACAGLYWAAQRSGLI